MKTLSTMTDEELVVLYAEGNNAAFDHLLNRYKSSIHSYIYFVVRNKELTEDIFQEYCMYFKDTGGFCGQTDSFKTV